jgi:hypothetical protein
MQLNFEVLIDIEYFAYTIPLYVKSIGKNAILILVITKVFTSADTES